MTRASLGIWTGAGLALLLAGCSPNLFMAADAAAVGAVAPGGEQVVYGKLDVVAKNTKTSLEHVGLHVEQTAQGGAIRLASATRYGKRFVVVLTSDQTKQGERVLFHVEWQDPRDDQAEVQIVAHVQNQGRR
jgi:hypothetical protein